MKKRHSRTGIISFALGLSSPLLFALGIYNTELGFSFFLLPLALIPVGLTLGVIGLFFKNEKQIFSIFGIFLNLFWICLISYFIYNFQWRMF